MGKSAFFAFNDIVRLERRDEMSHYSKKDILRLVEEEDVEFIRLQGI